MENSGTNGKPITHGLDKGVSKKKKTTGRNKRAKQLRLFTRRQSTQLENFLNQRLIAGRVLCRAVNPSTFQDGLL